MRLATRSALGTPFASPTSSRMDESPGAWRTSVDAHIGCEGKHSRSTPTLFKLQQELFALRRRLAYLLASASTDARASTGIQVPLLGRSGRRAALALSLAHSIFRVCAESACAAEEAESVEETATRVAQGNGQCRSELGRYRSEQCGGARFSSSAAEEQPTSFVRLLQPEWKGYGPYMYRSLAQPVELAPAEVYALLKWCADQVRAYASAVAAAANRKDPELPSAVCNSGATIASAPHCAEARSLSAAAVSSSGERNGGGGEEKGMGCERRTLCKAASSRLPRGAASATRGPSTLSMARCLSRDCFRSAEADNNRTLPLSFRSLDAELVEEAVSNAAALMGLTATLARMAAESALPTADEFSGCLPKETAQQGQLPRAAKVDDAGRCCEKNPAEGGEVLLGRVVGDVVLAVCGALHTVHDAGLLGAYVAGHAGGLDSGPGHDTSSDPEEGSLVRTAILCEQTRRFRSLHRRLSFSPSVLQSVLCCERESWSLALRLVERMAAWNAILSETLGTAPHAVTASSVPSQPDAPPSPVAADGGDTDSLGVASAAPAAALLSLNTDTVHMLLYVLAQHGRLAEVLRLIEAVCGVRAFRALLGCLAADDRDATADAALVLIAQLAVANADPTAAVALLRQASSPAVDASPCAADSAASAVFGDRDPKAPLSAVLPDRTRCVERVVRAGLVPQRVLSITEYAVLLRRVMGNHIRGEAAHGAAAGTPTHSSGLGIGVGWWLSPSQVWRFSAGLPHHARTALCLTGFQVNMHHGLTDMLSLEDLYVVLTISRQLVRRHDAELRRLRARQVKPADDDDGDAGSDFSKHPHRQWATWGVVSEGPRSTPLRLPGPSREPPPLTFTGFSTDTCETNSNCPNVEPDAPYKALLQCTPELLLRLLPARRRAAGPASTYHIQQLCVTSYAALRRAMPTASSAGTESETTAPHTTATARLPRCAAALDRSTASRAVAASAVLLSLISQEMLSLLRAARYTRKIALFWDSALSALAVQQVQGHVLGGYAVQAAHRGGGLSESRVLTSSAIRGSGGRIQATDYVREEVANALALQAEAAVGESLLATRRLVAPLPALAPYLSAYTVAALVQRPFRRAFTWQQCAALLPYTPLGSRSQLWLLQRVARDSEGRRVAFPGAADVPGVDLPAAPGPRTPWTLSALSIAALETAARMVTIRASPRSYQQRQGSQAGASLGATPGEAKGPFMRRLAVPWLREEAAAPALADTVAEAECSLLALLLEGNWARALQALAGAPSRVQVGGASHVVRLLVEADVWRDLDDAQRQPLARLAMQSTAHYRGGASGLLEDILKTALEQGLWHSGLSFYQSVAVEQPELVRKCRHAQRYAAQLCRGLLERTSMTKTVAHMTKAARHGQWAEAAACFLRYATQRHSEPGAADRSPIPVLSSSGSLTAAESGNAATPNTAPAGAAGERTAAPRTASTTAVLPTTTEELESLAALLTSAEPRVPLLPTAARAAASSPPFALPSNGNSAWIPADLAHVAQTARYAMLRTPALWTHALRWLPTTALPLPFHHEQMWRDVCADNTAKLWALLPPPSKRGTIADEESRSAQLVAAAQSKESTVALVASTTEAALSLVEAARRAHRPRHTNEAAQEQQIAVADALRVLQQAGAWEQATLLYDKAVESQCMPYASSSTVLATALQGGAPWQVTLMYFFRMSQRQRPDVNATTVALQACVKGGQWEAAFRVLRQSVLTQASPAPRLVMLAVSVALECGAWSHALATAHQYRRTRSSQLAHVVLLTYVRTQHWDDATEYFYDCIRRGLRPLDASLELAIIASEAASSEYRKTALMVGAIASALEDLYRMSGVVLEHIIFVHRRAQGCAMQRKGAPDALCGMPELVLAGAAGIRDGGEYILPQPGIRLLEGGS
ncbi:hypothetical protein LSCM1_05327 [Leishmania martiniquensis]|uniref:Uncharacterized protein n=1 Tax=Leishmania martiniquensis TaxID=1580590 RepID=A0A836KSV3_9TRYP|nr:hypothetical protein LSCM1_05327 [Leishmania martiniquensis]